MPTDPDASLQLNAHLFHGKLPRIVIKSSILASASAKSETVQFTSSPILSLSSLVAPAVPFSTLHQLTTLISSFTSFSHDPKLGCRTVALSAGLHPLCLFLLPSPNLVFRNAMAPFLKSFSECWQHETVETCTCQGDGKNLGWPPERGGHFCGAMGAGGEGVYIGKDFE